MVSVCGVRNDWCRSWCEHSTTPRQHAETRGVSDISTAEPLNKGHLRDQPFCPL